MTRIACVGEAMIELSLDGDTAQVGVAGDTLNTAIYLHRTAPEVEVDYVTRLGSDPFSHKIRDFVGQQGIGCDAIEMAEKVSPGLYAITTTDAGERSFTYWRETSAARGLFQNGDFSTLENYDAVYLSGITMAILPHDVRLRLIDWLAKAEPTLIYDSNYRPSLWDSVDHARQVTTALWDIADIALPSIDDEMELYAQTAQDVIARTSGFADGALKRAGLGPLSLGEEVDQAYEAAAQVVDTTAAGDSFNGAYIAAILSGASQAEALMTGHTCAAKVVQHRGAIVRV